MLEGDRDIQVVKNYGNLPQLKCYPGKLNQVFMSILNNAIDAIKEFRNSQLNPVDNYQGQITISTEVLKSQEVMIRIIDNGSGMTQEIQQKIFDPFFTTKPIGSATGLGMSISYQIIKQHGGQLKCISAPLQGTEFLIQIPIDTEK